MMKSYKKISQKKGLTLTELLVSTVLVGIVMVGIVSFNFAVNQIERSSNKSSALALEMATLMSHISRNAALAVGYSQNPGVLVGANWIAFRKDINNTPNNYSDDVWSTYSNSVPGTLSLCENDPAIFPPACGAAYQPISDKLASCSFSLTTNSTTKEFYADISLTLRYAPLSSRDPITNPEITMSTRISPKGHSW